MLHVLRENNGVYCYHLGSERGSVSRSGLKVKR